MSQPINLRFGFELEVVTGSRKNRHTAWHDVATEITTKLLPFKLTSHVNGIHDKSKEKFEEWSIIPEISITDNPGQNQWGMELVSPILHFDRHDNWKGHLSAIWYVLESEFKTISTNQCSTHIRLSPSTGQWALWQLKRLCKAICYFERSIDSLVPGSRRLNIWCLSNRWNPYLAKSDMPGIFQLIDNCTTVEQLTFIMCCFRKDPRLSKEDGGKDVKFFTFRWNLTPLCGGGKGTVEFRQPPGSTRLDDSHTWIRFAVAFVEGAVARDNFINPHVPPSLQLLWQLLGIGISVTSFIDNEGLLSRLFTGKSHLPPGKFNMNTIDTDDYILMIRKAMEDNITLAKFKKLHGYK